MALVGTAAGALRISSARAHLNDARARVHQIVRVGEPLTDAETALVNHGYKLVYDTPIYPIAKQDYMQQGVIIGDNIPSWLDSLCYAAGLSNPLSAGSPYVIIDASPGGSIIRVE